VLNGNQIQITPVGAGSGSSVITVTVAQPANQYGLSSQTQFTVNVIPVTGLFGTSQGVVINDRAPANPYPSVINISNMAGNIVSASVSVLGLQHSYPSDISMLLVGPQGQQIVLMSRAGSGAGSAITGVNLTFDDSASALPPQTGLITSGTYKPSDYNGALQFYTPVNPPYVTNLSALKGANPNGDWKLYVQDDLAPDNGQITGGWLLKVITTAPTISFVAAQSTPENAPLVIPLSVSSALTTGDKLTLTAVSVNENVSGLIANISVTGPGTSAATSRTLTITPGANLPSLLINVDGTATITLTATDGTNTSTFSFPLTVVYGNQIPVITGLSDQVVPANSKLSLPFTITDADSGSLLVNASSSVSSLGVLKMSGTGNSRTLAFTPSGALGLTVVTVTVSDGISPTVTNTFNLTVAGAAPPVFGVIPDQQTIANTPVVLTLPVTDPVVAVTSLSYSSSADNPGIVGRITFSVSGSSVIATIKPATNAIGSATVTIVAKDAVTNASTSFLLTVTQPVAPEFDTIEDITVIGNNGISVPLPVTDEDLPIYALNFNTAASNTTLITSIGVAKTATNATAVIQLGQNQLGTSLVTIDLSDGFTNLTQTFRVTVVAPAPMTLAPIDPVTTSLNVSTNIALTITSSETALNKLSFTGSGTNGGLVKGVAFSINGSSVVATINVVSNRVGFDVVTIGVSDGFTNVTQSFPLTVTPMSVVKMSPIGKQNTMANVSAKVALTVTDPDTSVTNLVFTGSSTNKNLVSNVTFSFNGRNMVAIVNLVANRSGSDYVTISATDGFSTDSESFQLTVGGTAKAPILKLDSAAGQLNLSFAGAPNAAYGIQSSTDLHAWTDVTTVTADSSGSVTYTNPVSTTINLQFYRAVVK
jgi:subtilisin-like proprotein convertase family protein